MITVLTLVEVAQGREAEVTEMWHRVLDLARRHAGFHKATLMHDTTRAGCYAIHAEWETRAQFDDFVRATGVAWLNRDQDLWHQAPTMVYDEVVSVALRAETPVEES